MHNGRKPIEREIEPVLEPIVLAGYDYINKVSLHTMVQGDFYNENVEE